MCVDPFMKTSVGCITWYTSFPWNYSWSAGDLMALYKAIATRSTLLLHLIPNQAIFQTFIFWLSKTLFWFSLSEGGIFCNLLSIEMVNHMMFYINFYVKYIHWVLANAYQIHHGYYRRYKVVQDSVMPSRYLEFNRELNICLNLCITLDNEWNTVAYIYLISSLDQILCFTLQTL